MTFNCPFCEFKIELPLEPNKDELTICPQCETFLIFKPFNEDRELYPAKLTVGELLQLPQPLQDAMSKAREAIQQHKANQMEAQKRVLPKHP